VPPNSSRLSRSWGVDFTSISKWVPRGLRFLDWTGKVLSDIDYTHVEAQYDAPYYCLHRADLIKLLVKTASQHRDITLRMNTRVQEYDYEAPAVTLATGERLTADLVVCADGIKSAVRNTINGAPIDPQDTGDVAYRVLIPADQIRNDPEMRPLLEDGWAMHWIGPEAHAVGYPLRGGELYNIIIDITHNTDVGRPIDGEEWRSQADNTELVQRFADWCPQVRKLCGLTGSYLKWKLADFDHLQRWVHPSGKVAILGDACHPMVSRAAL
jgi:salicylate hydroxylase